MGAWGKQTRILKEERGQDDGKKKLVNPEKKTTISKISQENKKKIGEKREMLFWLWSD